MNCNCTSVASRIASTVVVLLSAMACGGESNNGQGTAGPGACVAQPPANINITLCASIVSANGTTNADQCSNCCSAGGYDLSSFANGDKCTCGAAGFDAAGASVCSSAGMGDPCWQCCNAAGYLVAGTGTTSSCECSSKYDREVCKSALSQSDPVAACGCCCLNHGFLSYAYQSVDTPMCECTYG
jgi:hypothetical protein